MKRALVVDDSRAMCSLLRRLLSRFGFESDIAHNGEEALKKVEEHGAYDVALIDHNMPIMNGIAMIEAIREHREYDHMKLLMVTGDSDPRTVVRALRSGADEYAMKPITVEVIEDKLRLLSLPIDPVPTANP
ncbi:response regulator [Stomatohabitans albus]|uniref:response regulator n=1 Tax=Stomatohabitans albus TaxID=3110766 RepID=UPI00300D1874